MSMSSCLPGMTRDVAAVVVEGTYTYVPHAHAHCIQYTRSRQAGHLTDQRSMFTPRRKSNLRVRVWYHVTAWARRVIYTSQYTTVYQYVNDTYGSWIRSSQCQSQVEIQLRVLILRSGTANRKAVVSLLLATWYMTTPGARYIIHYVRKNKHVLYMNWNTTRCLCLRTKAVPCHDVAQAGTTAAQVQVVPAWTNQNQKDETIRV